MKLNKQEILNQYNYFKNTAVKYLHKNEFEKSAKYCEVSARIGYKYNFKYCDDELEEIIQGISDLLIPNSIRFDYKPGRIIFFDSFSIDNRGLTQQYIRAIKSWGFELLYITTRSEIGYDINEELKLHTKYKIIKRGLNTSFKENICSLVKEIEEFKPQYVIQHYSPWDIIGFIVWNKINNVDRFLINLTDHAFWIGKKSTDYFLEFRNYGCYLSSKHRNINLNKLLFQPYYPIQSETPFKGFAVQKGNNLLAFAGSSFYKIYGRNGLFFTLIKSVLLENKNLIFLLAGNGNDKPIRSFIRNNNLQDRFILLGDRRDINEVIKHIDIYVNTYPMIGGLMSQLAAINKKPIIGYTDNDLYSFNDTEDFLQIKKNNRLVKCDQNSFLKYFNELIRNEKERERNVESTKDCVISNEEFNKSLLKNIVTKEHIGSQFIKEVKTDLNAVFDLYVDMELNYLKEHESIIWNTLGKQILIDNFWLGLHFFRKRYFRKYFKKV